MSRKNKLLLNTGTGIIRQIVTVICGFILPRYMLLVMAYGVQCPRVPYFRIIKAAGHFNETQNGAYISAGLNIVITITFVFRFGLVGATAGIFSYFLTQSSAIGHESYLAWLVLVIKVFAVVALMTMVVHTIFLGNK